MEMVDILRPPTFEKTGETKTIVAAWEAGDWIATFNLWILKPGPVPSFIYQQRSMKSSWEPGKLDVSVGGHYSAGEQLYDGLREAKEELGKDYKPEELTYLGRRLHVSIDAKNRRRNNVIELFLATDDSDLSEYVLEEAEVSGLCVCPIDELIRAHTEQGYRFEVDLMRPDKTMEKYVVSKESFPWNWDNYHFKMALLAKRYITKEKYLVY